MKKYLILILAPILVSFSKKNKETSLNNNDTIEFQNKISEIDIKDLHGDWYFEREILSENSNQNSESYSYLNYKSFKIINDSVIDFKIPFLYPIETKIKSGIDEYVSNSLSLGSETKFNFSNNKIKYLNKEDNNWVTIFIEKIEQNKLFFKLDSNGSTYVFNRITSTFFDTTNYDIIILTQGSCFGSCPLNSTYLNRDGQFYFKSTEYNTVKNGLYSSTIDKNETLKIFNLFDKINFKSLNDLYTTYQEDVQTNFVTFIKKDRIIKTIELESNYPIDLLIAESNLSYLYQKSYLKEQDDCVFKSKIINGFFGKSIILEDSEMFYLEILLEKGNKGNFVFNKKYNLDFFEWGGKEKTESIFTDGRYYQINYKDNTSVTIDIGFNFIDKNPILKKKKKE